ncbi:MAG: hypothetical protein RIT45_1644 [Pseudomonadota bacterium]
MLDLARTGRFALAALVVVLAGCAGGANSNGGATDTGAAVDDADAGSGGTDAEVSADAAEDTADAAEDTADTAEDSATADTMDTVAPPDGGGGGDVGDAATTDAADAADVPDVPDVADVADIADAADVLDVPDVPDVADVPDAPDVADTADTADAGCVPPKIARVLHIAVDGLQVAGLKQLIDAGKAPAFAQLFAQGAHTLEARCDYAYSITLPNMTSMMTGRPVSTVTGQPNTVFHGYTSNVEPQPGETLHAAGNPALDYVASIWDVAHDHGLRTGLYASKLKFSLFDTSYDASHGAADAVAADNGKDKIDDYVMLANTASLTDAWIAADKAKPYHYTFLHLADPDSVGHAKGWGSEPWLDAVAHVDKQLDKILAHLATPGAPPTILILTADHGGYGKNHTNPSLLDVYRIPFAIFGPGVPAGADLYTLMPKRASPGTTRPKYDAKNQPIRNGDAANLALELLGLPPVPGSFMADTGLQLACPSKP